jgi:general secretion pathway protein I
VSARRQAGFTLLEVLVAFVIAALAIAVLFEGTLGGLQAARTAGAYQEALSRAQSHLAVLGPALPLAAMDQAGDDGSGFRWRLRVVPLQTARPAQGSSTPAAAPTLYAVTVTVSWTAAGQTRSVSLNSDRIGLTATR